MDTVTPQTPDPPDRSSERGQHHPAEHVPVIVKRSPHSANPDLRLIALVAALTGAAFGAILALVVFAIMRPQFAPLAGTAVAAVGAVTGGAIGACAVAFRVRP
jgi:hypothetical protein